MGDSRSFEVAIEVLYTIDLVVDSLIVVFCAVREDEIIGQTVPSDQLAFTGFEQRQVWVGGAYDAGVLVA
jgi:hypothetical protein